MAVTSRSFGRLHKALGGRQVKENENVEYFIGWDVGGWNCEKNQNSRDALVILDEVGVEVGQPWRGNLRKQINAADSAQNFLSHLFNLCGLEFAAFANLKAVIAIDAPLGFPIAFRKLLQSEIAHAEFRLSASNEYLFRWTERRLAKEGIQPLSAIKDMIGSQATKAMHVVGKFAPLTTDSGVWTDGRNLTVIETYPALCRFRLGDEKPKLAGKESDIADARMCARVAWDFEKRFDSLEAPSETPPEGEGWIWAPRRKT